MQLAQKQQLVQHLSLHEYQLFVLSFDLPCASSLQLGLDWAQRQVNACVGRVFMANKAIPLNVIGFFFNFQAYCGSVPASAVCAQQGARRMVRAALWQVHMKN